MRLRYLLAAVTYGLVIYLIAGDKALGFFIAISSIAFLFGAPFVIGYLTARGVDSSSGVVSTIAPWVPVSAMVFVLYLTGSEGAICLVMALPLLLVGASSGGLFAHIRRRREDAERRVEFGVALLLPLLLSPLERQLDRTDRFAESVTAIEIAASAARVWDEIAEVDSIAPTERGRALYTAIGFPAPIAATLDIPQEGGIRRAIFEQEVLFTETITEWEPERSLAFEIDPSIDGRAPTLDPRGRIGGEYFGVLSGAYTIEPLDTARVRLVLRTRHRVSTRFNVYAGWWGDRVMMSVQRDILAVLKARAEDPARGPKSRIRAATVARAARETSDALTASSFETGFSVVADLPGRTDVYADSVVIIVRRGRIAWPRLEADAIHDSTSASMAYTSGSSWNTGNASVALAVERRGEDTLSFGPIIRFSIPRAPGESLEGRWVVFTHFLTVPKTADNPYGAAWTYTHAAPPEGR